MSKKNIIFMYIFTIILAIVVIIAYFKIPKEIQDANNYKYKIEKGILDVTYSNGEVWKRVPVTFSLNYETEFKEGTYQMSMDKTVFAHGGDIIYSNNKGKTWETSKISDSEYGSTIMYIYFFNVNEGIALVANDYAMGSVMANIYNTTDGGATWSKKHTNSDGFIDINRNSEIKFFNSNFGFISDPINGGNSAVLWMTADAGKTFNIINLPDQQLEDKNLEWNKVYDYYELPEFKDGVLTVIASQGYDADYKGGNIVAKYQSKDMGVTWQFIEEYINEK